MVPGVSSPKAGVLLPLEDQRLPVVSRTGGRKGSGLGQEGQKGPYFGLRPYPRGRNLGRRRPWARPFARIHVAATTGARDVRRMGVGARRRSGRTAGHAQGARRPVWIQAFESIDVGVGAHRSTSTSSQWA